MQKTEYDFDPNDIGITIDAMPSNKQSIFRGVKAHLKKIKNNLIKKLFRK